MESEESLDHIEYERRFQRAVGIFSSASAPVTMARRLALLRKSLTGPGMILVGENRLREARRVGLLASSMNPLTRAHVALAEAAKRCAELDMLCWVVTAVTVDKERVERASPVDRLVEARLYAEAAGDGLLLLTGGLYVEQARAAHALLAPEAEVIQIVGFDKIVQIFDPRYYADRDAALHELSAEAELAVAPRAGADEDDLRALLARPENRQFAERVRYCPLPPQHVYDSSTEARAVVTSDATGPAKLRQLRELLTPEGLALTLGACPYAPERPPGETDLGDWYSARQELITALTDIPAGNLAHGPALGRLVKLSADAGAGGAALRAWVHARGKHTLAGLHAALALSDHPLPADA
jgi:hypothetical protein